MQKISGHLNLLMIHELPGGSVTPVSSYLKLRDEAPSFLLESGGPGGGEHESRYSFVGVEPSCLVTAWSDCVLVQGEFCGEDRLESGELLDTLRALLESRRAGSEIEQLPFLGGAVGYLAHDALSLSPGHRHDERRSGVPKAVFMFCDTLLVFDHLEDRLWVLIWAPVGAEPHSARAEMPARLEAVLDRLASPVPSAAAPRHQGRSGSTWRSHTREEYENAVRQAQTYISENRVSKLVLSQQVSRTTRAEPFAIYRQLRRLNPAPYMFYLRLPKDQHLLGSSPARFIRCRNGIAALKPLAGTRPRGRDVDEDAVLAEELLASPKERLEHLMMVELAQAELKTVCRADSVRLAEPMHVERFARVMHLASAISGEMLPGQDALDLVRACLPPGAVTGMPKEEALKILKGMGPKSRGVYGGAVGYVDGRVDAEFCVAIRSMFMDGSTAYLQAGGGVVAGSNPTAEYEESLHKLKPLEEAIARAESSVGDDQA